MKHKSDRIDCVVRDGERFHRDVANRKLRAGPKNSPVPVSIERRIASKRFRGQRVAINRDIKLAAKHVQPANVIAMFMGEQNAIELFRRNAALLQAQHETARTQSAIDQNFAVIGRDQRAISRATAPEHGEGEHAECLVELKQLHKRKRLDPAPKMIARYIFLITNPR